MIYKHMKTFKFIVNYWHFISVFLAGFVGMYAILFTDDTLLRLQLTSLMFILLHFFEEFGFPGGFPLMGMKVLMGSTEMDHTKWGANNLNSMFGNWLFCICVYVLPIILPGVRFLVLAGMMFNFAEILMHLVLFNARQKTVYNPGLITGVFGLGPVAVIYFWFSDVFSASMFEWYDWVIAVVWMAAVFLFSFRSKLYWRLGSKPGYEFTDLSAYGVGDIPSERK